MTQILSHLVVRYLNNSDYVQLYERFGFISNVLIKNGLRQVGWEQRPAGHEDEFWVPIGFVFDFESVPNAIRGPIGVNKRGGAAHDSISRKNVIVCWNGFCLGITQSIAAGVYFEIMEYCDSIDTQRFAAHKHPYLPTSIVIPYVKTKDWAKRWLKSWVVRFWPGYWQKHEMMATALEIAGIDGDPYIVIEKLDALIKKTKQVSTDLKDKDIQSDETNENIKKADEVVEDLKDEKQKVVDKI